MKRWMVAAATGLAAVCGVVTPGTARAGSGQWYQAYQSGYSGSFYNIAAISGNDTWAVGDLFNSKGNTIYQPFIRHYDGSGWRTVTIPGAKNFTTDKVAASAANNVWFAGLTNSSVASSVVYRYDGSRWHKVPLPALTYVHGLVVLAPNNVWAFGSSGTLLAPGASSTADVFHWNGSRWQGYYFNVLPQAISASASNNVWMAGIGYSGSTQLAVAYRWNGSAWHNAHLPRTVVPTGPSVTAVSPSNVWVGWETETLADALHWDGQHWHTVKSPDNVLADSLDIVPDGQGGYWWGAFARLTGSTWIGGINIPASSSGNFGPVVRIPGTSSFLMAAEITNVGSSIEHPTIYRFDL
jgi:hypothetical protein